MNGCRIIEHNDFTDRDYYKHSETGLTSWELPDEVRFYVEQSILFPKVINLIQFDNYNTLVMMYSEINRDCSGFISEYETMLLLAKIGLYVTKNELHGLFQDRDVGGQHKIAFNEFIDMIVYLVSRNDKRELSIVLDTFKELNNKHDMQLGLFFKPVIFCSYL